MRHAKDLMENHGVLPSDFFNQKLKDFLLVLMVDEKAEKTVLSKVETGEVGV